MYKCRTHISTVHVALNPDIRKPPVNQLQPYINTFGTCIQLEKSGGFSFNWRIEGIKLEMAYFKWRICPVVGMFQLHSSYLFFFCDTEAKCHIGVTLNVIHIICPSICIHESVELNCHASLLLLVPHVFTVTLSNKITSCRLYHVYMYLLVHLVTPEPCWMRWSILVVWTWWKQYFTIIYMLICQTSEIFCQTFAQALHYFSFTNFKNFWIVQQISSALCGRIAGM